MSLSFYCTYLKIHVGRISGTTLDWESVVTVLSSIIWYVIIGTEKISYLINKKNKSRVRDGCLSFI